MELKIISHIGNLSFLGKLEKRTCMSFISGARSQIFQGKLSFGDVW